MTRPNRLKAELKAGRTVFGTWSMLSSPAVINVLGQAGLDFVVIDMEHGPMSLETVENQIFRAEWAGCTPIVRLGDGSEPAILRALDIGTQSLMVSHVATAQEAARIVGAAKYFPEGDRGLSPFTRNHGYSDENIGEKLKKANDEMFVGVLVEGKEGLDNLEEICSTPGLDMVYLGVYDISQSLGVPGEVNDPRVIKLVRECVKMISAKGRAAGSVARDEEYLKLLVDAGFLFISYRVDSAVLREGFERAKNWYREMISHKA
jgi:4-hydroxy-2-oxoheptanedioate aldolase